MDKIPSLNSGVRLFLIRHQSLEYNAGITLLRSKPHANKSFVAKHVKTLQKGRGDRIPHGFCA
jgi:hypothetical protein